MEPAEVARSDMVLPATLPFKRIQMGDKCPKGQSRSRLFKHLKQIIQADLSVSVPSDAPDFPQNYAYPVDRRIVSCC